MLCTMLCNSKTLSCLTWQKRRQNKMELKKTTYCQVPTKDRRKAFKNQALYLLNFDRKNSSKKTHVIFLHLFKDPIQGVRYVYLSAWLPILTWDVTLHGQCPQGSTEQLHCLWWSDLVKGQQGCLQHSSTNPCYLNTAKCVQRAPYQHNT